MILNFKLTPGTILIYQTRECMHVYVYVCALKFVFVCMTFRLISFGDCGFLLLLIVIVIVVKEFGWGNFDHLDIIID